MCFCMNRTKTVEFVNPHVPLYVCLFLTVWQWQDENAVWHNYDAMVTRKLEALHSAGGGGSVDVEICGRRYEINVGLMQQVNKDTKVTRKIQRCAASSSSSSEATLPMATAGDPASSLTNSVTTTSSRNKSNRKSKKG